MSILLQVKNLKKEYPTKRKNAPIRAVNGINFDLHQGETFGLVGESGCGKSTVAQTIIRLLSPTSGSVIFNGNEFSSLPKRELKKHRKDIQIIFQDPYASLPPRMTIEKIIMDPLIIHQIGTVPERKKRVKELLDIVGIDPKFIKRYPHEFSGGQRQRIGIARALALNPKFIILDEPVSALDVSIQSQILNLLKKLQKQFDLTYLFISHDLGVIDHICDRIGVMYLGKIVELTDKKTLFKNPLHPYTKALFSAVPELDPKIEKTRIILKGDIPSPTQIPSGCSFHTRCPEAIDVCKNTIPMTTVLPQGHQVDCHLYHSRGESETATIAS